MNKDKKSFEEVWRLIQKNAGKTIYTKSGIPFVYHIRKTSIILDDDGWPINQKNLWHAYTFWPVDGPGRFNHCIQRSTYVWAILSSATTEIRS